MLIRVTRNPFCQLAPSAMTTEKASNPYSAPVASDPVPIEVSLDFLPIMKRWERLRLAYNGLLVPYVFLYSIAFFPGKAVQLSFWICICLGGILANVCYLTAPTVEAYGTYFKLWAPVLTTLLFVTGLGVTALLAAACIAMF